MYSFSELKKKLKTDTTGFKQVRLAVMGDSATQFLVQAIKGYGYSRQLEPVVFEADFNQIERQILDADSELYTFKPEVTVIFYAAEKLLLRFNKLPAAQKATFADDYISQVRSLLGTLTATMHTKVIMLNLCEIDNRVFGNYASKTPQSFIYQLRRINLELMQLSQEQQDLFICDAASVQNMLGRCNSFSPAVYANTDAVFSLDAVPYLAKNIIDIVLSLQGSVVKCVVVDLDNTMWGGVIGDDGVENIQIGYLGIGKVFTEFQYWLKALKERGIILAVCSKNTESVAKAAFENHPDMVLRLDDFSVFVANWETKTENIRTIQSILNIGFDSMVFLDDNPFERNIVREHIPGIVVPELPEDPAEYLSYLYSMNLFETASFSSADLDRTDQYRAEAQRTQARTGFAEEKNFLASLDMCSEVQPFNTFNTPRVAQLSQRSNQFNLRTVRYSEADIARIAADDHYVTFSFTLEDKFGNNGLICAIIVEKETDNKTLFIDTWFMSCRVLKRGMEQFTLNTLMAFAARNGFETLKGEYLPTAKNELVKDHYQNLGFTFTDGYWYLQVAGYVPGQTFIETKNQS